MMTTNDLLTMQRTLEAKLLASIQEFERASGMYVHSVKVFRGDPLKDGRRGCAGVEVSAQLR